ncbi:hypothetical protein GYH30_004584 [Glycine max]|nr:hypothetical protein GYH30_004584 [Glycine max]
MPKIVIPSKSYSLSADDVMSSTGSYSSSKDTKAISPTLTSPRWVLPESQVPPRVDLVDLVSKDEGEDLEEDTSFEKDPSMDKEDLVMDPKFMEEDSL